MTTIDIIQAHPIVQNSLGSDETKLENTRFVKMQPRVAAATYDPMENPNLYGGDMLGGLGFGNRTFNVSIAVFGYCNQHSNTTKTEFVSC
jgi:hypothetical protein